MSLLFSHRLILDVVLIDVYSLLDVVLIDVYSLKGFSLKIP